jgi:hypothetical protein
MREPRPVEIHFNPLSDTEREHRSRRLWELLVRGAVLVAEKKRGSSGGQRAC